MKMTNYTLINIMNVLKNAGKNRLPQRISYAITRNLMIMNKEYKCYEESLKNIFNIFSNDIITNENGDYELAGNGLPKVRKEKEDAYYKEINDLLNIEIDVEIFKIPCELFNYDESDKYDCLSASDMTDLQSILCDDI